MDVGKGCCISDNWIPKGVSTDLRDINGNMLKTADKVQLDGCTSSHAIIGRDADGKFMLFFGSNNGSVGWHLTQKTIDTHNIRLCHQ